ncbi:tricarballylate utilization 4Fe-4S protein TcuB [uncultured Roseibium sp.]|uniref:tricarballylate utilization 4Fe-4S protein TcuB n=1 Tax=uncultured Roseibium sp. TaxID=1936171 RepID=UPI00260F087B|nr:tricarballylate utilization 4Fe-4S protein TcuB [uncultured Roseibium sp.]
MQTEFLQEARRQAEICNACRYCEGYCSVFPALHSERFFSDGNLTQLANLCHNCRGCYYACQYTSPHEFDLNLPKALAEVRQDSWDRFAWPMAFAKHFQNSGLMIALASVLCFAVLFLTIRALGSADGEGFYAVLSHSAMVSIFLPAFLFPLFSLAISMRRYWRATDGEPVQFSHIVEAFGSAGRMKNLAGGHGDGCNFEEEDRFSQSRRFAHQAIMYGFLLCFASTSVATILHYVFDVPAPYPIWSLPKLLGIPGGIFMVAGSLWLMGLKLKADRNLGAPSAWGGEMAFVALLFLVALSGLLLYALGSTGLMPLLLAVHLGSVLSFFLLTPYTKMVHGFYRLAALIRDAQRKPAM